MLLLAEAVSKAGGTHAAKVSKELKKRSPISIVFKATKCALLALTESQELAWTLRDALQGKITAVFEHSRGLRNESGHPTATEVTDQDAEAGLLLFPEFCGLIYDLIAHLERTTTQKD